MFEISVFQGFQLSDKAKVDLVDPTNLFSRSTTAKYSRPAECCWNAGHAVWHPFDHSIAAGKTGRGNNGKAMAIYPNAESKGKGMNHVANSELEQESESKTEESAELGLSCGIDPIPPWRRNARGAAGSSDP